MNLPPYISSRGVFAGVLILDDALTGRSIVLNAGASQHEITSACHEHRRRYLDDPPVEDRLDPAGVCCAAIVLTFAFMALAIVALYFWMR